MFGWRIMQTSVPTWSHSSLFLTKGCSINIQFFVLLKAKRWVLKRTLSYKASASTSSETSLHSVPTELGTRKVRSCIAVCANGVLILEVPELFMKSGFDQFLAVID